MSERDGEMTRQRIVEHVQALPGIHKSGICRDLNLSWGTISYHLRILDRMALIRTLTRGREVCVFPAGIPEKHMQWVAALRDDDSRSIVEHLADHPGGRVRDLSGTLGLPRRVVRRHLTSLAELGIVRAEGAVVARFKLGDGEAAGLLDTFPKAGSEAVPEAGTGKPQGGIDQPQGP